MLLLLFFIHYHIGDALQKNYTKVHTKTERQHCKMGRSRVCGGGQLFRLSVPQFPQHMARAMLVFAIIITGNQRKKKRKEIEK